MPLRSRVTRQKIDQRWQIGIDPDAGRILAAVQTLDRFGFFQQVLTRCNSGRADLQPQIVFDFLQRHFDRVFIDRTKVSVDFADGIFGGISVFDEKFLNELVLIRIKHQALRRLTIASGSPGFLIIRFNAAGQVVMHNKSQIGFINPHAESIRRDNNFNLARHEFLLDLTPRIHGQACVIKSDAAVKFFGQQLDQLLAVFSRRSVNNSAAGMRF